MLAKDDKMGHHTWKVSELSAIQSALTQAAARRRWLRAWNGLWRGLFAGAVIWLLALAVFKLAPIPSEILNWAGVVAVLLTVSGFFYGWYHKPTLQQTARWMDNDQHLQERLSTALELGQKPGNESWRALIMADAARYATKLDPRKLIPIRLPAITRWALLALVVSAGLGFLPEYRTQAYLQKKQDQQAVKTAGKILLDITKRNLERHDPLLPPVEKSLQAVQELGLKMDKVALTRGDALKDLANVSEKVKSEQKELGRNPMLKALEKSGQEKGGHGTMASAEKQMESLEKELGKSADNPDAVEKLAAELAKVQKALANMPQGDSPGAQAARAEMAQSLNSIAQQAKEMGQQLPDLDAAIAALQNSQMETFRRDMDAATVDLNKLKETAQALQKLQQQGDETGKDLPEQLKKGQSDAAQASLQKMIDQLKSGKMTPEQAAKTLDEVARSVDPASPYGKASEFLKKAAQQMKSDQKADAAESLADASKELDKVAAEMADAKALEGTLAALQKAEDCLGNCRNPGSKPGEASAKLKAGTGQNRGVGGWTPDDSTLYPEMSATWDNTGINRKDSTPRGQTDRGDMQLADNLNPTKFKGQLQPGGPMPSINLKGVSIKGQSSVEYQQAAAAAQSDAQSALNQDQVPRAYQGAVKNYFDDIKK